MWIHFHSIVQLRKSCIFNIQFLCVCVCMYTHTDRYVLAEGDDEAGEVRHYLDAMPHLHLIQHIQGSRLRISNHGNQMIGLGLGKAVLA